MEVFNRIENSKVQPSIFQQDYHIRIIRQKLYSKREEFQKHDSYTNDLEFTASISSAPDKI